MNSPYPIETFRAAMLAGYVPPTQTAKTTSADWRTAPVPGSTPPATDDELIAIAIAARRSGLGAIQGKASFRELHEHDDAALRIGYGDGASIDESLVDLAYAGHLHYFTGGHHERIERLMRARPWRRDKWDERRRGQTWLQQTILEAGNGRTTFYTRSVEVPMPPVAIDPADPLAALGEYVLTDAKVDHMEATRLIWLDIVAQGHVCVLAAPANGGKTTIIKRCAADLAKTHRVYFFQEDASAGDLPALFEHAKMHGYQLLNSSLASSSRAAQVEVLRGIAKTDANLSDAVLIFDTLKKYVDLMSKGGSREFFHLMRELTIRGATVILLGHTNKHLGQDGKPVFEGVGDVRNDVDELFYVRSVRDGLGLVTMTVTPDKSRCKVKERSFTLDTNTGEVCVLDRVVDVAEKQRAAKDREEHDPIIRHVQSILAAGPLNHSELRRRLDAEYGVKRALATTVIDRYAGGLWVESKGEKNARVFAVRSQQTDPPSDKQQTQQTQQTQA